MLDDVRRHLVDRAIERGHVGRREAHGGGRLADDGQRGGQVPRLGEKREAGDLLLCRLVGLHARGSHLRPPRVQIGPRRSGRPCSVPGCAPDGVGATVPSMSPTSTSPLPPQETLASSRRSGRTTCSPRSRATSRSPRSRRASIANWAANGHIERAVALIEDWGRHRPDRGLDRRDVPDARDGRRSCSLDVPGTSPETVLLYGHCDKQPEMVGWDDGLGPWTPSAAEIGSTAAGPRTTATRCSAPSPRSRRCSARARRTRAASS